MASKRIVRYKCPFCENRMTKEKLVDHIEDLHDDMVPEGFTPFRYVFHYVNKRPLDYHGKCTECGGPTPWDEKKGRYNRQCDNLNCKVSYIRKFEENMMRTKGVTRISGTVEGQEKMLANRRISGTYKFQNGKEKTYTGSYELKALQFMDMVLNIDPDDILAPGPILEYMYNGEKHFYISDFYYQPYNLVIEVKDGGAHPNKRDMPEYRAKQIAKEEYIVKHTTYNYLRLTDNDFSQLLSAFADLKMQMVENSGKRVIRINEAMNALMSGYIPGIRDTDSVYVVNYLQNNAFSGDQEQGMGISNNCKLTNLICRNKRGELSKAPYDFLETCRYDVYLVDVSPKEISKKLAPYMGSFVEEGFLYETLFHKKMYTFDQIMTEESAIPVIDFYKGLDMLSETVKNFILNKSNDLYTIPNLDGICYYSIKEGCYSIRSSKFPELMLESNSLLDEDSIEYRFLEGLTYGEEGV